MAGSIIISAENVWTVGSRWFGPVVERIRSRMPVELDSEDASIFSSMEEGFDFLGLEKLSPLKFKAFVRLVEEQRNAFSRDGSIEAVPRHSLLEALDELITRLRRDPRATGDPCTDGRL